MRVTFGEDGWADYSSWSDDRTMLARINRLIGEALREPGAGIGKPEPLGQNLIGWSTQSTGTASSSSRPATTTEARTTCASAGAEIAPQTHQRP